jgi:hypothetical protein
MSGREQLVKLAETEEERKLFSSAYKNSLNANSVVNTGLAASHGERQATIGTCCNARAGPAKLKGCLPGGFGKITPHEIQSQYYLFVSNIRIQASVGGAFAS